MKKSTATLIKAIVGLFAYIAVLSFFAYKFGLLVAVAIFALCWLMNIDRNAHVKLALGRPAPDKKMVPIYEQREVEITKDNCSRGIGGCLPIGKHTINVIVGYKPEGYLSSEEFEKWVYENRHRIRKILS